MSSKGRVSIDTRKEGEIRFRLSLSLIVFCVSLFETELLSCFPPRESRIQSLFCLGFRMNQTCVMLLLFVALVSCAFSSYLDIPPPPERPFRFKTKEQIENYLKAVKDYYDAFKIKLVRRSEFRDAFALTDEAMADDQQPIYRVPLSSSNALFRRRYRLQR